MHTIRSLLGAMRGRQGMYTGTTSLTKLAAFLRGYDMCLMEHDEGDHLLPDFRDWIHERFGTTKLSWEDCILRESANESDAVNRFYDLLDEFLKQYNEGSPKSLASSLDNQTPHNYPVSGAV